MTTQTEALKRALEQTLEMLIDNREYIEANERSEYLAMYDKAIAGAEKALAEQPAPVKQEPVAWMKPHPKCDAACLYQCTKGFQTFPECAATPQAQRKPLTLQELEAAWNAQADHMNTWDELGLDEIVAWAQAAHNIKEKNT